MLNKQPIHVVQRDCKQWSLQAVDVLQALCWQSLVSSVGMQLLNVDENQKRRCRTVSSYISIYHMILENYFDNCVCFTFCIFLGIAVLVSHCCYSSLYGIVMGCHRHCLNRVHWIIDSMHRVPFQRCHQLSSRALPSRGIAQPARGPTRPRASAPIGFFEAIKSTATSCGIQRSTWLWPLLQYLPLGSATICRLTLYWYVQLYIYVRSVSQWQLSAWKIWKWFTLWKCSKYVLLFINYDLLEFMINVAIEIFFAPSPQMAPGGSRPPGGSGSSWLRQCLSDRYGRSYCSMPDTQMTDFHHQSWEFKHPKMWVNHQEGGVHPKNVI